MTEAGIVAIVEALGLPSEARVEARVPKKLLLEQGAPTSADKRAIQGGVDELRWLAACKPTTIGVPAFRDEVREYLEIAVISCAFRSGAKVARLIELIHRAIPYPVFLITSEKGAVTISVAHKRHAQNEAGKTVVDRVISVTGLQADVSKSEREFMASLPLAHQPRRDLSTVYDGWLARIEALVAARLSGVFQVKDEIGFIDRRRAALDELSRLARESSQLRSRATRTKQINQRVDLNQRIQAIEAAIDRNKKFLLGDEA